MEPQQEVFFEVRGQTASITLNRPAQRNMGLDAALEVSRQVCEPLYANADAKESERAFAEKHRPRWEGK